MGIYERLFYNFIMARISQCERGHKVTGGAKEYEIKLKLPEMQTKRQLIAAAISPGGVSDEDGGGSRRNMG